MTSMRALAVGLLACCWQAADGACASPRAVLGRRAVASLSASAIASWPFASRGATFVLAPVARIAASPPLEYLEPIYELKLSLDALAPVARDPQRFPALRKRLDKFFGGGPLSEKFYYLGLSVQYTKQIKYDDLDDFVRSDQQQRALAMEDALQALENCRAALALQPADAEAVASNAAAAKGGIERWLSLVPKADVERCDALFRATREADANRDGKLDASELATLQSADRATWEARVALVGP